MQGQITVMDLFNQLLDFPSLIHATRIRLGESAEEFGKRFGKSKATVSLWEHGKREADYQVIYFCIKEKIL